jgi:ribosome-associated protein
LATLVAEFAANKKAEDVIAIDLRGISSFTDFFVVCSGTSEPHLKAIAGEIQDKLRDDHDIRPTNVDGYPTSQWVVMDYGDVLVHIFHHERRGFYALEDLWSDAPRLPLPETTISR